MNLTKEEYKYFFLEERIPNTIGFVPEEKMEEAIPYYLDLYNPVYGCLDKLHSFKNCLTKYNGLASFLAYKDHLRAGIVRELRKTEAFQQFNSASFLDNFPIDKPIKRENKSSLYEFANHGRWFLSIDLVRANFSSLKFYNKDLVLNKDSYEDFLKEFTEDEYFIHHKGFRNNLFKSLNPAHFSKLQNLLSDTFLASFMKNMMSPIDVVWVSDDETVISIDNISSTELYWAFENVRGLAKELNIDLHLDIFQLKVFSPIKSFVKEHINQKVDFKCVKPHLMPQVFKHYFNLPLSEMDLQIFKPGTTKFVSKLYFEK